MTMINSGNEWVSEYAKDRVNFLHNLNNPQWGRRYLTTALESKNEQILLAAIHNLIDAILWDLEYSDRPYIEDSLGNAS